jgi:hypothetical protein
VRRQRWWWLWFHVCEAGVGLKRLLRNQEKGGLVEDSRIRVGKEGGPTAGVTRLTPPSDGLFVCARRGNGLVIGGGLGKAKGKGKERKRLVQRDGTALRWGKGMYVQDITAVI